MTDLQKKISFMTSGHDDIPHTEDIRCKNCIYCIYCKTIDLEGSYCRRFPPYCLEDGNRRFTWVNEDHDWCGEFVSRIEKE